ncbi:hypothetical protein BGX23_012235 [Mortierella sp. AD031]|nr:hypothetical protein BGX23_012235 [Mortierella sp. AD031]
MTDPVAQYIHAVCYSYSHYFNFHGRVPQQLNEREGFADTTWAIIRGALMLFDIESRYLDVPIVGVEERKNADKDLLEETKEQTHQADGVGYLSEGSQVYLAESSVLYRPDARKRAQDERKVKRDMRDSLISQLADLCKEALPPTGFSVFGSTSFGPETKFYKMDIAGVFRLQQIGSMSIPLSKNGFGPKLRRCITTALEFALHIAAERDKRGLARDISDLEKQKLLRACSRITRTTKSPTNNRVKKKE